MSKYRYIKYIGKDIILNDDHPIEKWRGKTCLTKNKLYKLDIPWDGISNINGYNIFYIYDNLDPDNQSRGYEIKISDILLLRDVNLSLLLCN